MSLRLATFNVENLMNRFDFTGFRNQLYQDRVLALYEIKDETEYKQLERARTIAHTDDTRQLTALALAATRADIICLQEVDNMEALKAFEYGYLFKMIGAGYREKYTTPGNDGRGIDVAVLTRDVTRHGQAIEFVRMQSHAHLTYADLDLFNAELALIGEKPHERIFRRDCLELDLRVDGKPFTIYSVHFKSMGGARNGLDGRLGTAAIRMAEAAAVRRIIEDRFGVAQAQERRWAICGDFNDYAERVLISGDQHEGFNFEPVQEAGSCLDILTADGFSENVVQRRPEIDRWTLYHTRGPAERHLCQLDYILLSRSLARSNSNAVPEIIRAGQPFRTPFPPGQEVERYPRTGWDRPKSSDHCPVVVELDIV